MLIGDKARFAVEIGDYWAENTALRRVDLWAANRWLSCDDNQAYVGSFVMQVQQTIDRLRSKISARELAPPVAGLTPLQMYRQASRTPALTRWQLLNWDETTDNFSSYLFRVEDRLVITFEFWREHHEPAEDRGKIFVTELPVAEFVEILERMLQVLCADGASRESSAPMESDDADDLYVGQLKEAVDLIRQAGFPAEILGKGGARFVHAESDGRAAELAVQRGISCGVLRYVGGGHLPVRGRLLFRPRGLPDKSLAENGGAGGGKGHRMAVSQEMRNSGIALPERDARYSPWLSNPSD